MNEDAWVDLSSLASSCLLLGDTSMMLKFHSARYSSCNLVLQVKYLLLAGETKKLAKLKSDLIKKGRFYDIPIELDEH